MTGQRRAPRVERHAVPLRLARRLGPYARSGYVSKALHSHVSLLKFCCTQFGVPPWNERLRQADDMSDCFDFGRRPAAPPSTVPGGASVAPGGAPRPGPGPPLASVTPGGAARRAFAAGAS